MKNFKWTDENINFLTANYASKGAPHCAKELGTSTGSVHAKANRLGLKSKKNQKRTHKEYEQELMRLEAEYIPLETYIDSHTAILHECFNGHVSSVRPYSILSGKGCNKCDTISRTKTHKQYVYEVTIVHPGIDILDTYINSATPIRHKCIKGHIWWARPNYMLKPSPTAHCPDCTGGGFNGTKPGILYYIKIEKDNLTYYKIGITNRSIIERFKTEPRSTSITVLLETPYTVGQDARQEEQRILKKYSEHRQNIPELLVSGGNTELFEFDVLGLDK